MDGKESAGNAGDPGATPGSGGASEEGSGRPLQCSCLEKSMDRGSWRATVRGVTKSRPQRSSQPWNGTGGVRVKAALPARVELAAGASGAEVQLGGVQECGAEVGGTDIKVVKGEALTCDWI